MTIPPFEWSPTADDLEDDAICLWEGMTLRYECLGNKCWWWAVTEVDRVIAESIDPPASARTHHAARLLAEGAAVKEWVRRMPEGGREGER